jgi:two-component system sensor histidine kinase KdpD
LLLNYYVVPPLHTLSVERTSNVIALVVFLLIAVLVSRVVDLAAHRSLLAESDRQRTALLNAVSHDLRTPLSAAKAAVSSLRSGEVPWSDNERRELLATAEDAIDRLTALVTNLLDLSRLQAGALAVMPTAVGLDDVVARTLEYLDPQALIVVDVPADLPAVHADAGLLERALANVLENALRYAPPGSKVEILGGAAADGVQMRIVDRGPGIDDTHSEAVFRPFQRTDDAPSAGVGVGLGLAIARGFIESMGGAVALESTPGGGTTVVLTLRVAVP